VRVGGGAGHLFKSAETSHAGKAQVARLIDGAHSTQPQNFENLVSGLKDGTFGQNRFVQAGRAIFRFAWSLQM
jgi:hypothetical protein